MERLILIRHGETAWNRESRPQGISDVPLSDRGKRQARAVAEALADEPLAGIYASDLARARATAEAIGERQGLSVGTDPRLREMNQGVFEGEPIETVREQYAEWLKTWIADPANVRMPGGETLGEVQARAWAAIEDLHREHPTGVIAVVAHNFTNVTIICAALKLDLGFFRRLQVGIASISTIEFGRWPTLIGLNDQHHLRGGLD